MAADGWSATRLGGIGGGPGGGVAPFLRCIKTTTAPIPIAPTIPQKSQLRFFAKAKNAYLGACSCA